MARDPLLYSSKEHNIEVYLSDIDTLLRIGCKKRLLLANVEKTKKISDVKEYIILFEKSAYDPERKLLTMKAVLSPEIKLSESSWTVSVDSNSFCQDVVTDLVTEEPSEDFLFSKYGQEFMNRIVGKIKKTAFKNNFLVIEENITELGFVKCDNKCINTFESCNFSLNLVDVYNCSRDMEHKGTKVKIEINVNNYTLSIGNCTETAYNSQQGYRRFLINTCSDFEITRNNLKYTPFESFKSEDDWKKDRSRHLSAYGTASSAKISNKMFSF